MKSVRIMVWECIHSTVVGYLTNVGERLNGYAYIDLLGSYMIPSVHLLSLPGTGIFQQDNVPFNTLYSCNA